MLRSLFSLFVLIATITSAAADDKEDPEFQAYVLSLFQEKGKAQTEFDAATKVQPLLAAYSVGLFAKDRCHLPQPTQRLYAAAGGDEIIKSSTGKRVFAVAGVVATMTYPTGIAQANVCDQMRRLLDTAEQQAAKMQDAH